jgi:hypothetical protein
LPVVFSSCVLSHFQIFPFFSHDFHNIRLTSSFPLFLSVIPVAHSLAANNVTMVAYASTGDPMTVVEAGAVASAFQFSSLSTPTIIPYTQVFFLSFVCTLSLLSLF